jgi:hypothetical protein
MEGIDNRMLPRAAVWDSQSGHIIYAPQDTWLVGFVGDGSGVVTLGYAGADHTQSATQPRVPEEFWFEYRTWPRRELVGSCTVRLFSGWPHSFVASPHNNLVVIRTIDQQISGWDFVVLTASDAVHVASGGFEMDSFAALSSQPGYSPDGRYAVSGYHTTFTETYVGRQLTRYEIPLTQAEFEVGGITVVDLHDMASREIVVLDAVPAVLHTAARERLDQPAFIDNETFEVTYVTEEIRRYSVRE